MLIYFGLTFAAGLLASGMSSLYGIPFTDFKGEYGLRRAEALRELNLLADIKKAELLHLIAERQGDAAAFCESPVLRRLVSRVCSLAQKPGGARSGPSRLRSALQGSADYRSLTGHLATIKQTYMVQYDKIRVADAATGLIITSTDERDVGMDMSRDPGFIKARGAGQDQVMSVLRDAASGNAYLSIHHAIRRAPVREGAEDAVTAVLALYLKPDVFINSLELNRQELGKTGEILLVDQDTRLLTPLQHALPDGNMPKPLEFRVDTRQARLAAEGNEGIIFSEDYGEVPVLAAFRHLRLNTEVGWGMVVKKDQAEVFAPIRRLMYYLTLKGAFLFLLVLGLTYAIATKLSRPIKLLSLTAKRVEQGDLDARSETEGGDEVGVLAGSFNAMVQRIQNWHTELEESVNSRTAELVSANAALEGEIVERSRMEEALRVSEGRFRELLETVQLVAVILDREGNIIFCNDYFLDQTGWSREEVLGHSWFDTFIPEEARGRLKHLFSRILATSAVTGHYENQIVTKSGARRTIVWDNTLLRGGDGGLIGIAGLGTDVTEHRGLEEQFRQSQKMEAIGQLAGGVAHDFNNLLTAIIGNCELIRMKSGPNSPFSGYLEQIMTVSGKAANLTQSLLAFSRRQYLSFQGLDLNDCVRGVDKLLSRVIGEDINFRLVLTGTRLPVMADRGQMEHVLVNLATNARDAMPGGGELLIETRRADLDTLSAQLHGLEKSGVYAIIQVSDTGCGMDEATRERIFDPFFTTKEVGKGTGLGLAMVFGTIRQHGGYIDVYSELGSGTVFKIYLPLVPDAAGVEDVAAPETAAPGGDETVLLVEDSEDVRKSTALMLEEFGYRVIEAADGEEALARFAENRDSVRVVILDVIMPGMNGKEVYDALRKTKPELRALFISGYAADIINRTVMKEEGLHLLQKPVTLNELLQKVRELLDNG
ncbi:MAG: PAS domain S-box protein [Deltaproteobacteria bacterium]|nr:PAS domain S-box protein [Deltaproteobacteria bacterium]